MDTVWQTLQIEICHRFSVKPVPSLPDLKVGVSLNLKDGIQPINGMRCQIEGDTTGWYIWAGEGDPSTDPDYFVPLHVEHLETWCPQAIPYLQLPSGWRFLVAPDYEDIWFDESLMNEQ